MKVKICGVTSAEDALAAAAAGADLLGLNFYPPSPRALDAAQARTIADAVRAAHARCPPSRRLRRPPAAEVEAIDRAVGLDLLQFSGDEPAASRSAPRGTHAQGVPDSRCSLRGGPFFLPGDLGPAHRRPPQLALRRHRQRLGLRLRRAARRAAPGARRRRHPAGQRRRGARQRRLGDRRLLRRRIGPRRQGPAAPGAPVRGGPWLTRVPAPSCRATSAPTAAASSPRR